MGVGKTEYERLSVAGREIAVSNPGKVLFPQRGFTKLDLVRYYLAVADADMDKIKVLMTVVGGKTVYLEPAFAKTQNLEPVGLKIARTP